MSTDAHKLVENMLDSGDELKNYADQIGAEDAAAKASGEVNPRTVRQYDLIYHKTAKNSDGTAARAKVTSIKTWKTRPNDFEIGWKHGMYDYGKITPSNASEWTRIEPPPVPKAKKRR